jgi:alanine-synthesizing transaminase
MEEFSRIPRLPPYVFNITGEMKASASRQGVDIIDFGLGNPDGAAPRPSTRYTGGRKPLRDARSF